MRTEMRRLLENVKALVPQQYHGPVTYVAEAWEAEASEVDAYALALVSHAFRKQCAVGSTNGSPAIVISTDSGEVAWRVRLEHLHLFSHLESSGEEIRVDAFEQREIRIEELVARSVRSGVTAHRTEDGG